MKCLRLLFWVVPPPSSMSFRESGKETNNVLLICCLTLSICSCFFWLVTPGRWMKGIHCPLDELNSVLSLRLWSSLNVTLHSKYDFESPFCHPWCWDWFREIDSFVPCDCFKRRAQVADGPIWRNIVNDDKSSFGSWDVGFIVCC